MGKAQGLGGHVVQVAGELGDGGAFLLGLAQHSPHTVGGFKVLFAHAVAGLFHTHHRGGPKALDKVLQQRRAGGGAKLPLDAAAIGGHPL